MANNWNKMQQSNRQPQLHLQKVMQRLAREKTVIETSRLSEQSLLWTELFHSDKEYQNGLRRTYKRKDFMNPKLPIHTIISNKLKVEDNHVPLSQVYREYFIFKTKKTLELFGDHKGPKPRYSDLYSKMGAPKENNERSLTLLLDRRKSKPDVKPLPIVLPLRLPKEKTMLQPLELPSIEEQAIETGDESGHVSRMDRFHKLRTPMDAPRQSVSREMLQRGRDSVTKEIILSARDVQLEGLQGKTFVISGESNMKVSKDQTFLTQSVEPSSSAMPVEKDLNHVTNN